LNEHGELDTETNSFSRRKLEEKGLESIPPEFKREIDNAKMQILSDDFLTNAPYHSINSNYVYETILLPSLVEYEEIKKGRSIIQKKTELAPYILIIELNGNASILDIRPILKPLESMTIGKKTHLFKVQPGEFERSMDLQTINSILNRKYVDNYSNTQIFEILKSEIVHLIEVEEYQAVLLALWIAGSYVHDVFPAYPYLWFNGVKGSGKTLSLTFIEATAYHAEMAMMISNSALFRDVDEHHCTICYDEAENLLISRKDKSVDQDRVSLFNSGYKKGQAVRIVEKDGDNFRTRHFMAYSPKALASIQPIDETLQNRCILINMLVARNPAISERLIDYEKCQLIRQYLYQFRFANGMGVFEQVNDAEKNKELRKKYDLKNRDWELFKPILFLAEAFCPDWLGELNKFLAEQKIIRSLDNQFSTDAIVMEKLLELSDEAENTGGDFKSKILYKELIARIKETYPELKWMTGKSLGNCLRRLGLAPLVKREKNGYILRFEPELLKRQAERINVKSWVDPQTRIEGEDKENG